MIYCNCYQRFRKGDFEVNASLKKIKKKLINAEEFYNRINNGQKRDDPGNEDLFLLIAIVTYSKGVFLSVNPKTDFRSKNEFRVPFGKSKSGFLIW